MSAPNKSYDPVEVAALSPEEIQRALDEALAAIAAAAALDELKAARLAHSGDRAPIVRPVNGSVTVAILLWPGDSSGAKALRCCRSEPMLTVAGTKGQFSAPPSNRKVMDRLE